MKLTDVKEARPPRKENHWADYSDDQLALARVNSLIESPSFLMEKEIKRRQLNEKKSDSSELPEETLKKIKSNISKGAKDEGQQWANALELVHTAYDVSNVQRPDLTMEAAWKQYEEMIAYACEELAKARGLDGDWRTVTEEVEEECEYSMETEVDGLPVNVVKKSRDLDSLIKPFFDHNQTGCDIELRHRSSNNVCLHFVRDGKRTGDKVTIRKMKK